MTLYGFALFVHVLAAIALVGGTAWLHVSTALLKRARTVDGARTQVDYIHVVSAASMKIAMVVLAAGVYLAFAGDWWGAGWPAVSLVLFAMGGMIAGMVLDPAVAAAKAVVEELPDGPMTAEIGASLANPRLSFFAWVLTAADVAIVYLMTSKPGWTVSVVAAVVALAAGAAMGARENRAAATAGGIAPAA